MRHQLVTPEPEFHPICWGCEKHMNSLGEVVYADLDGPSYRAYYCGLCTVRRTEGFVVGMAHADTAETAP